VIKGEGKLVFRDMDNLIENKSFDFAVRIVKLSQFLNEQKKEFVISKQILRSGTSIGANVAEAQQGQSHADFISKMNIALKEAAETKYWIRLLEATGYLTETETEALLAECVKIEKILYSIVRTSKIKK
jgi:four helix bundle protein